jgi:hypothetical protein
MIYSLVPLIHQNEIASDVVIQKLLFTASPSFINVLSLALNNFASVRQTTFFKMA